MREGLPTHIQCRAWSTAATFCWARAQPTVPKQLHGVFLQLKNISEKGRCSSEVTQIQQLEESWNILKGPHKDHQIQLLALNRISQNSTMLLGALSQRSLGSGRAVNVTTTLRRCQSAQLGKNLFPKSRINLPCHSSGHSFKREDKEKNLPLPVLIP